MLSLRTTCTTLSVLCAVMLVSSVDVAAHGTKKKGHGEMNSDAMSAEQHPFGRAGDPTKATRAVTIDMSDDLRFAPDAITVKKGETVKFIVKNNGKLMHEMVLGTKESLAEHAELMKKFPGMEHSEPYMAHVAPGEDGMIGWEFTDAGEYEFGCLVPGHYDGGMKGRIVVE